MGGHLVLRKYVPPVDENSTNPDLEALVALINAADDVDGAKRTTTVEQLRHDMDILPFRPVSETYLAKDEGDLIGYARLEKMVTEEADCFACRGIVRPDRRREGIGTRLVQHALTRARALKGRTPSYFDVDTSTPVAGAGELARSLDLKPVRWFLLMGRALTTELPQLCPVPGIRLRPFVPGRDEDSYLAGFNAAFSTHWGFFPLTRDDLSAMEVTGWFDPDQTIVAQADGEIVGLCVCTTAAPWLSQDDGQWALVEDLAVVPGWQRCGLGRALLATAVRQLHAAGYVGVYLGVDTDNVHDAKSLYQSAGFEEVMRDVVYRLEI